MATKIEYILNGRGSGSVSSKLISSRLDCGALRPWEHPKTGKAYVTLNAGRDPESGKLTTRSFVSNAPALLRKDEWIYFDQTIERVARPKLRVWGDISAAGLTFSVPNGMGTTVIQHQTMTDYGEAALNMSGLNKTYRDRPEFDLINFPLPIVHSDFSFDLREIETSRNKGTPLDTLGLEMATRRCVELVEKLTLGNLATYTFGGGTIYGLRNVPQRLTKVMTLPTTPGWTASDTIDELLDMIQSLNDIFFGGPYALFVSPSWSKYLDADYSAAYPNQTLRSRIRLIEDVASIRKTDLLSGYQMVLVQLSNEVIQAVTGMPLTTLQWSDQGGLEVFFKVLGIMVPRIRWNADDNTGIAHGTAA